ncbi:AMP-binding protein [Mesorhizobium sp. B2-4-13]|uniref:AMP-binding protein n=1 Tax=Mesorhizobium sp. B2-4-13 TaxID=2589936 RepID=UPI0011515E12|nr:AMP-binding protein [Mesorhizobium sp. B2-4-13]TPK87023.1 AMP-binding protein [Mesorhizobium sp. B2-4-13]
MRIIDFFDRGAERFPDNSCVSDGVQSWTYSQVQALSHGIGATIRSLGVGDCKVAVLSPNHPLAYIAVLGIMRAGAVWVTLNAKATIAENEAIIEDMDAEVVLIHSDYLAHAGRIAALRAVRNVICLDASDHEVPSLLNLIDVEARVPDWPDSGLRAQVIMSSGGTTGRPKGVVQTVRVYETMVATFRLCAPPNGCPRQLLVAPMSHAAGAISWSYLADGAETILLPNVKPIDILKAIEVYSVTHIFLPPTLIYVLLSLDEIRDFKYSSLQNLFYAAAPMSSEKLREAIDVFGPVLTQTYGQAEANMICTFMSPQDHIEALRPGHEHRLLSCGRASPLTRVEIMSEDGSLMPCDEVGEIVLRGGLIMGEYYRRPDATEDASAFGWHHTGDLGRKDADGFVYIVGRKRDMIISGGFNIFPGEIEQVVWAHPAIRDCAVIGIPDEKWGEAVTAVVELREGAEVSAEEIIALCKLELGSIKAPKSVIFEASLPRSPVGKVLKKDIRARFWQGRERQI